MAAFISVSILFFTVVLTQAARSENPVGSDGTIAGNLGNDSPETCSSGTTQLLCQPNMYTAPTDSTVKILTELNLLRQEVTHLNDRLEEPAESTGEGK